MEVYKLIEDTQIPNHDMISRGTEFFLQDSGDYVFYDKPQTLHGKCTRKFIINNKRKFEQAYTQSHDNQPIYKGDEVFEVSNDRYVKLTKLNFTPNMWATYFKDKDKCFEYLLEQKRPKRFPVFEVGKIVTIDDFRIKNSDTFKVKEIVNGQFGELILMPENPKLKGITSSYCRLATTFEKIDYFRQLGWVAEALVFINQNQIGRLKELKYNTSTKEMEIHCFLFTTEGIIEKIVDIDNVILFKDTDVYKDYTRAMDLVLEINYSKDQSGPVLRSLYNQLVGVYSIKHGVIWSPDATSLLSSIQKKNGKLKLVQDISDSEFRLPTLGLAELFLAYNLELFQAYFRIK